MKLTRWHKGAIDYERPKVMGILNVTPDSFSDGGKYLGKNALAHVFDMIDAGVDMIDIGGESTRPYSKGVTAEEEISRIAPILKDIVPSVSVPISVDTMKTKVAEVALDLGADIINDIYGLRDEGMLRLVSSADVPVVIMHMHGMPETMQINPMQGNVIPQIIGFLEERTEAALDFGVKKDKIILDPGVGFGKTSEQNVSIIDNASIFGTEYPVLIGGSRKGFLSKEYPDVDREEASVRVAIRSVKNGVDIVRVHDVRSTVNALRANNYR
jgi:dihydropteroate synthase